jgi:hypothetical protein
MGANSHDATTAADTRKQTKRPSGCAAALATSPRRPNACDPIVPWLRHMSCRIPTDGRFEHPTSRRNTIQNAGNAGASTRRVAKIYKMPAEVPLLSRLRTVISRLSASPTSHFSAVLDQHYPQEVMFSLYACSRVNSRRQFPTEPRKSSSESDDGHALRFARGSSTR